MYTIKILDHISPEQIICRLVQKLIDDGRFKAEIEPRQGNVILPKVRLTKPKEYCGQHPGSCPVDPLDRPKKRMRYLEWEDWVALNDLVNDVLDELSCGADVFSKPMETDKLMYMRRGRRRRIKYDWFMGPGRYGQPVRLWNHGSDDQFAPDPCQPELPFEATE